MKKLLAGLICLTTLLFVTACVSQSSRNAPKVTLENTFWMLSSVTDKTYNPPAGVRLIHIQLNDGKKLSGYLGCNNLIGSYQLLGTDGITFTAASSRMMCMGDGMAYENRLNSALSQANRYQVGDGKLRLYQDQKLLAEFVARK